MSFWRPWETNIEETSQQQPSTNKELYELYSQHWAFDVCILSQQPFKLWKAPTYENLFDRSQNKIFSSYQFQPTHGYGIFMNNSIQQPFYVFYSWSNRKYLIKKANITPQKMI